ncbi:uncharacterized protein LOC121383062 [Gigantopelta aegis]|uniref:uncharacterized protein LOC121383062 n=1 Tax=Gigantopelta aegis TaxID=1735272 RepID=UPI001B88811E|nr:uncharacterized protein LOC121383062 [Gigantopelta aegis]
MKEVENMSTVMYSVDHYDDDLENQKLMLELSWLARKDQIRQEFVSFHAMLIDREEELISKMEHDVQTALAGMSDLMERKHKLERTECQISDECLNLVQEETLPKLHVDDFFQKQEMLIDK